MYIPHILVLKEGGGLNMGEIRGVHMGIVKG